MVSSSGAMVHRAAKLSNPKYISFGQSSLICEFVELTAANQASQLVLGAGVIVDAHARVVSAQGGTTVGEGSHIGSKSSVSAKLIGRHVIVGARAIVGDGACIGDDCVISDDASVPANAVVAPGTMVHADGSSTNTLVI
jgi:carbonic anhydrase/acetyltransferase-like protein (isoleucine patch superfamily)